MCVKDTTTVVKHVGKLLARIETSSICCQQFANVFADCFCAVCTHQLEFAKLEFANSSLPCEGHLIDMYTCSCFSFKNCLHHSEFRLKEVQASDKLEMQSLQKQVRELQSGNTSLQMERDKLSEELQVIVET